MARFRQSRRYKIVLGYRPIASSVVDQPLTNLVTGAIFQAVSSWVSPATLSKPLWIAGSTIVISKLFPPRRDWRLVLVVDNLMIDNNSAQENNGLENVTWSLTSKMVE
jgi:hypothetical protein